MTLSNPELEALLKRVSSRLESEGLKSLVEIPGRGGSAARPDPPLPAALAASLKTRGITSLWSHQLAALQALRRGEHTTVSTGTASGKSLCFNLPVIERILANRRTRALYLYPTKALAQDQLRAIRSFGIPQVGAATYDGDTPSDERPSVRQFANIVLSNPDMLHFGILPSHARWADFFSNLAFVVVDEAHVLRGIFGSHVGCILRRLRRIALHYGSDPLFVLTSATMPNPGELAARLVGVGFTEVVEDGAPRGSRLFAFWNPPFVDERQAVRGSANWESARLMAEFVSHDIKTIAFAKSRKGAELIAKYARAILPESDLHERITAYRAGYLPEDRRAIERRLFGGELLGVAATTALELGIDVGGLDAVVLNGFPGTVSQVWQQAGRAGRSRETSVAVLVGRDDPLDQYYISHPDILLSRPFEVALVDPGNPNLLEPHLGCAAYELPIENADVERFFGTPGVELASAMASKGDLALRKVRGRTAERYHWKRRTPPGVDLDLRSMGGPVYSIVDEETGLLVGTVDGARAFQQVHPGAVYLHQGENLEVSELDLVNHVALITKARGNYYTESRENSDIRVLTTDATKRVGGADFFLGRVEVTRKVVAFARKDIASGDTLAIVDLDLPDVILDTVAVWYTLDEPLLRAAGIGSRDVPGSLHAAEHAAIGLLPLFAMADRWDIGGMSTPLSTDTWKPTVFIYDGHPGGAGIAERGFAAAEEHLGATLEAVANCPCESGCPSCIQSPKCGNGNDPLDKQGAIRLLSKILGVPIPSSGSSQRQSSGSVVGG
ncbi:MAG: DEAD/DEAH box helicase [Actinomycetota bacterium]|nr:DEAD/DEAH box helicase [Actinomycetota bacterium]